MTPYELVQLGMGNMNIPANTLINPLSAGTMQANAVYRPQALGTPGIMSQLRGSVINPMLGLSSNPLMTAGQYYYKPTFGSVAEDANRAYTAANFEQMATTIFQGVRQQALRQTMQRIAVANQLDPIKATNIADASASVLNMESLPLIGNMLKPATGLVNNVLGLGGMATYQNKLYNAVIANMPRGDDQTRRDFDKQIQKVMATTHKTLTQGIFNTFGEGADLQVDYTRTRSAWGNIRGGDALQILQMGLGKGVMQLTPKQIAGLTDMTKDPDDFNEAKAKLLADKFDQIGRFINALSKSSKNLQDTVNKAVQYTGGNFFNMSAQQIKDVSNYINISTDYLQKHNYSNDVINNTTAATLASLRESAPNFAGRYIDRGSDVTNAAIAAMGLQPFSEFIGKIDPSLTKQERQALHQKALQQQRGGEVRDEVRKALIFATASGDIDVYNKMLKEPDLRKATTLFRDYNKAGFNSLDKDTQQIITETVLSNPDNVNRLTKDIDDTNARFGSASYTADNLINSINLLDITSTEKDRLRKQVGTSEGRANIQARIKDELERLGAIDNKSYSQQTKFNKLKVFSMANKAMDTWSTTAVINSLANVHDELPDIVEKANKDQAVRAQGYTAMDFLDSKMAKITQMASTTHLSKAKAETYKYELDRLNKIKNKINLSINDPAAAAIAGASEFAIAKILGIDFHKFNNLPDKKKGAIKMALIRGNIQNLREAAGDAGISMTSNMANIVLQDAEGYSFDMKDKISNDLSMFLSDKDKSFLDRASGFGIDKFSYKEGFDLEKNGWLYDTDNLSFYNKVLFPKGSGPLADMMNKKLAKDLQGVRSPGLTRVRDLIEQGKATEGLFTNKLTSEMLTTVKGLTPSERKVLHDLRPSLKLKENTRDTYKTGDETIKDESKIKGKDPQKIVVELSVTPTPFFKTELSTSDGNVLIQA